MPDLSQVLLNSSPGSKILELIGLDRDGKKLWHGKLDTTDSPSVEWVPVTEKGHAPGAHAVRYPFR